MEFLKLIRTIPNDIVAIAKYNPSPRVEPPLHISIFVLKALPKDVKEIVKDMAKDMAKERLRDWMINEVATYIREGIAITDKYIAINNFFNGFPRKQAILGFQLIMSRETEERLTKRQYYMDYKITLPTILSSWDGIVYKPIIVCAEFGYGSPRHPLVCNKYIVLFVREMADAIEIAVPRIQVEIKNWRQAECFSCIEEGGDANILIELPGAFIRGTFKVPGHCTNYDGILRCWSFREKVDIDEL